MFSRKTRKFSIAILVLIIVFLFGFCIINNHKEVDVSANDKAVAVDYINIVYPPNPCVVYASSPDEVFPALPSEAELVDSNGVKTGQMVALTWTKDVGSFTYTASFDVPNGYYLSNNYQTVTYTPNVIESLTVLSLNGCTVNVLQNQKYTLPETLKGKVKDNNGYEYNDVDIAVTWNEVVDTTKTGTKDYIATATGGVYYKIPIGIDGTITANLTLTVDKIRQHYQTGETFKSIEMDEYTLLGWAKADNASLGVFDVGTPVTADGDYFAIFAKLEYLGVSFRFYEQGVRFGFALKFYNLDDTGTDDYLKTSFVDALLKDELEKATFIATIYGNEFNYSYNGSELKYSYLDEYEGYVSNLVFVEIGKDQLDDSVKVDAYFTLASKLLSVEGETVTIRAKAQEGYEKDEFGVDDQETINKMAEMYGFTVKKG